MAILSYPITRLRKISFFTSIAWDVVGLRSACRRAKPSFAAYKSSMVRYMWWVWSKARLMAFPGSKAEENGCR